MSEYVSIKILIMLQDTILTDANQLLIKKICHNKNNINNEIEILILSGSQALIMIDIRFSSKLLA